MYSSHIQTDSYRKFKFKAQSYWFNESLSSAENLDQRNSKEKHAIATKLHRQFGHPLESKKLRDLCLDAGIHDQELFKQIDKVTQSCDTCDRYKKARARPVVSMPLANDLNDVLAMDLKFVTINNRKYTILHLTDAFTRFSVASIVSSKHKEVIVATILKQWVATFGKPKSLFSDNGGELNNELLHDAAELLDCKVITTAAFPPWSNGIVVFGRNLNLPAVSTAKPPALRTITPSELIAEHLNALHAARRAFIKYESSNKLKTALQRQTRNVTTKVFNNGDHVYYKHPDHKEWRGPGVISGLDGSHVLVRHGGSYVRVSPCHLRNVQDDKICSKNTATTTNCKRSC